MCRPSHVAFWNSNDATNAAVTNVTFGLHLGGFLVNYWSLLDADWATNDTNHNCIPDSIEAEYPDVTYNFDVRTPQITEVPGGGLLAPYYDVLSPDGMEGQSKIKPTGTGLKGQGNRVPTAQMFRQHYIVTRGNPYRDPGESYMGEWGRI